MQRCLTALILPLLLFPSFVVADEFSQQLGEVAALLPYLDVSDLLNDRQPDGSIRTQLTEEQQAACATLWELGHSVEFDRIEPALEDHDPKVRTLAIACAYWSGDPQRWMEKVRSMVDDDEASFPAILPFAMAFGRAPGVAPQIPTEQKTVGDYAAAFVKTYLEAAGYFYGVDGIYDNPGFDEYWELRRDLDYCPSWFHVQYQMASQRTSPFREERTDRVKAVRARVARVPSPDREWILLSLAAPYEWGTTEPGVHLIADEEQLIAACHDLGPAALRSFLRQEHISDHPEFNLGEGLSQTIGYARIAVFILSHATEFFTEDDVEFLLEMSHRQDELATSGRQHFPSPRWAIAAADLSPDRAGTILREEMSRRAAEEHSTGQDHRAMISMALWKHLGEEANDDVVDWFFREEPEMGSSGFGRQRVCHYLDEEEYRPLLIAILSDDRLDQLDWPTLAAIAAKVNQVAGQDIVSPRSMNQAWHPLGMSHYHFMRDEAMEKFPEETARLERSLDQWRQSLREFAQNRGFTGSD